MLMLKKRGFKWYEMGWQTEWFRVSSKIKGIAHYKAGFGGQDYPFHAAERFYFWPLKMAYRLKRKMRKIKGS